MRQARLKAPEDHEFAYYHTISRVVNREYVLGEEERDPFAADDIERMSGLLRLWR